MKKEKKRARGRRKGTRRGPEVGQGTAQARGWKFGAVGRGVPGGRASKGPALNGLFTSRAVPLGHAAVMLRTGAHALSFCPTGTLRTGLPLCPVSCLPAYREEAGSHREVTLPHPFVCQVPRRRWRWPGGNSFRAGLPSKRIPRG